MRTVLTLLFAAASLMSLHASDATVVVEKTAERLVVEGFTTGDTKGIFQPGESKDNLAGALEHGMNEAGIDLVAMVRQEMQRQLPAANLGAATAVQVDIVRYSIQAKTKTEVALFGMIGAAVAGEPDTLRPLMKVKGRLVDAKGKVFEKGHFESDFSNPKLPARKFGDYYPEAGLLRSDWEKVIERAVARLLSELSQD